MGPKFKYGGSLAPDAGDAWPGPFECALACGTCRGKKKNGAACTRRTCKALPWCWQHARAHGLRIGPSSIAGQGLFAHAKVKDRGQPVFRAGQVIARLKYGGKRVSNAVMTQRYGREGTAPYGIATGRVKKDGACQRSYVMFANDPRGGPASRTANTEFTGAGGLRALRNIMHGQEILVSYGDAYWSGRHRPHKTTAR